MSVRVYSGPEGTEVEYVGSRKRGPKAKPDAERRSRTLKVRVTAAELEEVDQRARALGTDMSGLVRGLLWPTE